MTTGRIHEKKAWTLLVFMAGDNNLSESAKQSRRRLERLTSEKDLHVAVQIHTRPLPGSASVQRLRILPGLSEVLGDPLADLNAGDPATLCDFLAWGRTHFPAERTALVIWGHGTGLQDLPVDFDWSSVRADEAIAKEELKRTLFNTTLVRLAKISPVRQRGIAIDATARDYLDTEELRTAIAEGLTQSGGGKLDLLGFDACLMNCVEVAYQLRDVAEVMVGSQDPIPARSWPYDQIVNSLVAQPALSTLDLADLIVGKYYELIALSPGSYSLATLELAQVAQTFTCTKALVEALNEAESYVAASFNRAFQQLRREKLQPIKSRDVADFYNCCKQIRVKITSIRSTPAYKALQELESHLSPGTGLVRSCLTSPQARESVHGVSAYWPQDIYSPVYDTLHWRDSGWGNFLKLMLAQS